MKSVAILVSLFAATFAISCDTCMEIDYGTLDYTALNLSTTIDPNIPVCSSAASTTCESDDDKCGNGSIVLTAAVPGSDASMDLTINFKSCMNVNDTCETAQTGLATELAGLNETEGISVAITSCSVSKCNENGTTCLDDGEDDGGAATMSLLLVSLLGVLTLL